MINHLKNWIKARPSKTIEINGKPYLKRIFIAELFNYQIWLHQFLSCDGERHLHNHPWRAVSIVLRGGYSELVRVNDSLVALRERSAGSFGLIDYDHTHRIISVKPRTWTMMIVGRKRKPLWQFIDQTGEVTHMATSPRRWFSE